MAPLSPITAPNEPPPRPAGRRLALPLDPALTLAVIGLGICSVLTLGQATRNLVPGDPSYYVDRQIVYLGVGLVAMALLARLDYGLLKRMKNGIYVALLLSILAVLGAGHS